MALTTGRKPGERRKPKFADLETDRYLTDGKRLFQIVERDTGTACLENCRHPEEQPAWLTLTQIVHGQYWLVEPKSPR